MTDFIILFVIHLQKKNCSPQTLDHYESFLHRFDTYLVSERGLSFSSSDIGAITKDVLGAYYDHLCNHGFSVSTRNNYVAILKSAFAFAVTTGLLQSDPTSALFKVKDRYTDTPPEDEDALFYSKDAIESLYRRLIETKTKAALRDLALVALMLGSGMRISEACSLNVLHAKQMEQGYVVCRRKGGKWQKIAVAPFAVDHVRQYLASRPGCDEDHPLFMSSRGNRLSRKTAWKSLSTKQKHLGIATGTHILQRRVQHDSQSVQQCDPAHCRCHIGHCHDHGAFAACGRKEQYA